MVEATALAYLDTMGLRDRGAGEFSVSHLGRSRSGRLRGSAMVLGKRAEWAAFRRVTELMRRLAWQTFSYVVHFVFQFYFFSFSRCVLETSALLSRGSWLTIDNDLGCNCFQRILFL